MSTSSTRQGFITVGASGQGKTHYCLTTLIPRLHQQCTAEQILYTSGDIEREELFDTAELHLRPQEVWQAVYTKVRDAKDKQAIIIDGTHLLPVYRAASLAALNEAGITKVTALVFCEETLEACQERVANREGHRIPSSEIERHIRTFVPVSPDEGFAEVVKL